MLVETLRADWAAHATNARASALPEFANGASTLGAGTKLAEARADRRDEAAEGERAVALVSVALGRPLDTSAATHVRHALTKAREGDAPLALTHLALAGVRRLTDPRDDACRLFIADGLMKAGVAPRAILEALDAPSTQADLDRAYDPDQPRVPAGNGRPSGQWTSGNQSGDIAADDMASPASVSAGAAATASQGIQIADASEDWPQYLDPIGTAEAAEAGGSQFNGTRPYVQHQLGVAAAIAHYQALGYAIFASGATVVDVTVGSTGYVRFR